MNMKKYAVQIHIMAASPDEALDRAASAIALGLIPHVVEEINSTPVQQELALDNPVKAGGSDPDASVSASKKPKFKVRRYTTSELNHIHSLVKAGKPDEEVADAVGRTKDAIHHITRLMKCDDGTFGRISQRYPKGLVNIIKSLRKGHTVG